MSLGLFHSFAPAWVFSLSGAVRPVRAGLAKSTRVHAADGQRKWHVYQLDIILGYPPFSTQANGIAVSVLRLVLRQLVNLNVFGMFSTVRVRQRGISAKGTNCQASLESSNG